MTTRIRALMFVFGLGLYLASCDPKTEAGGDATPASKVDPGKPDPKASPDTKAAQAAATLPAATRRVSSAPGASSNSPPWSCRLWMKGIDVGNSAASQGRCPW